jgi:LPXTG-motif cell wall-anchored protein
MNKARLTLMAVLVVAMMTMAGPALANGGYQERPPEEKPEVVQRTPEAPKVPTVGGGGEVLPITGSDLTLFVAAGVLIATTGAALVRRARGHAARL